MKNLFSMNYKTGKLEEIKKAPKLPYGCKVYGFDSPGVEWIGAALDLNEYGMTKIVKVQYAEGFDQSEPEYMQPLSKKFGIGIYYFDSLECFDQETINLAIIRAQVFEAKELAEENAKKAADLKEREELPKLYPNLILNEADERKTTKKNLVALLKQNFPGIKFSVRTDYSKADISWENGATAQQVERIAYLFESYESSDCGDYRDFAPSNFNRVFGGFKYIFTNRKMSEDLKEKLSPEAKQISKDQYPENFIYCLFCEKSIPKNAENFRIEKKENQFSGRYESDFYELKFDLPQEPENKEKTAEKIEEKQITSEIKLVNYSEKAIALFGNTKPIKEKLKELGGRFNPYLLNQGEKCAGWIFPKTKESQLLLILN